MYLNHDTEQPEVKEPFYQELCPSCGKSEEEHDAVDCQTSAIDRAMED